METREVFDVGVPREHWSEIVCVGTTPPARSGHIAVLYRDRYMFVVGGHDGTGCLSDLWCMDLPRKVRGTGRSGGCVKVQGKNRLRGVRWGRRLISKLGLCLSTAVPGPSSVVPLSSNPPTQRPIRVLHPHQHLAASGHSGSQPYPQIRSFPLSIPPLPLFLRGNYREHVFQRSV